MAIQIALYPVSMVEAIREIVGVCRQMIRCQPSNEVMRSSRISRVATLFPTAYMVLSLFIMPVSANAYGNLIDSYTYNGTQEGFPSGAVYTLSAAGPELNVCFLTPSGDPPPDLTYTPSCQSTLAPYNDNMYSAIAYLGTQNNPDNYFAVGDNAGKIYLMQIQFSSNNSTGTTIYNPNPIAIKTIASYTFEDVDFPGYVCGQITSLVVDPSQNYLYISCVGIPDATVAWMSKGASKLYASGAVLGVAKINSNGLGAITAIPSITPSNSGGYWANDYGASKVTAAVWGGASSASNLNPWVNAKLRAYPAGFPGLDDTKYPNGGVFWSGIISGISNKTPINSGLMCSNGDCEVAYNIQLGDSNNFSVITAAEYGVDKNEDIVLYWNQVQGVYDDYLLGFKSKTSNTLASCQLKTPISSSVTSAPCSSQNNLNWPPQGLSSTPVWVDQLVFSPTPANQGLTTSFVNGLLQMSTWNDGYVLYYDVASGSYTPGAFLLSNGDGGKIGANVYGMTTDANGNLLIQTGESGLIGFNAFPSSSTNIETQTDVTYVPIPSDSNPNNTCGDVCIVKQAYSIISAVVGVISAELDDGDGIGKHHQFALDVPTDARVAENVREHEEAMLISAGAYRADDNYTAPMGVDLVSDASSQNFTEESSFSDSPLFQLAQYSAADKATKKRRCCAAIPNTPAPTFSRLFGKEAYWASFSYSEKELKLMGLKRGDRLRGIQLRVAEGIGASPRENVKIDNLRIRLNPGPNAATVFSGTLCVPKETYRRDRGDGYGPAIKFYQNYRYRGGNLVVEVLHSGSKSAKRFYLDGIRKDGLSGAYAVLESVQSTPENIVQIKVAPMMKFRSAGSMQHERNPKCQ